MCRRDVHHCLAARLVLRRHLIKRSFTLAGHHTSLALEPEFWATLEAMAQERQLSLPRLLTALDRSRAQTGNSSPLASHCRIAALAWARAQPIP